jgi:hypothetical protein
MTYRQSGTIDLMRGSGNAHTREKELLDVVLAVVARLFHSEHVVGPAAGGCSRQP